MEINEKLFKQITETKYLSAENTWRYRTIIRFFYLQEQRIKYWMYKEDVYDALKEHSAFSDYTMDQCKQDLDALIEWNNLIAIQDTRKASTVEEFKSKQFRYQLSDYTVEIERMTIRLENLNIEGGSLEVTLLERLRNGISKFHEMKDKEVKDVGNWWTGLIEDFIRLNQNYQDYIKDLNSIKAEEMMKTKEFLVFKDKFIEYLRSFIKELQRNSYAIESLIKSIDQQTEEIVLKMVLEYNISIPRLDFDIQDKDIEDNIKSKWINIKNWFLGFEARESESSKLLDITNQIIRRITRYAFQIIENRNIAANRKEEYKKLCQMFLETKDIDEAHKLSAHAFGIAHTKHIKVDMARETDSINSGVYDETACTVQITPRVRTYREKRDRTPIKDNTTKKQLILEEAIERRKREVEVINSYIINNKIEFSKLPKIEAHVRMTLLKWLSRGNTTQSGTSKTEDGRVYKVIPPQNKERCVLSCEDGELEMPAYTIEFR